MEPAFQLPSVDRLLNDEALRPYADLYGRARLRDAVREYLAAIRTRETATAPPAYEEIVFGIQEVAERWRHSSLKAVVNLTGTVLHTNLGRAVLPESALRAILRVGEMPCNLEYDLDDGRRGERDDHVDELVCSLTGAEAAAVVNNNAAGVVLALNTLAIRREVVISRGELVEIGGSFRMPEIKARSGARLREVGTTNRTYVRDYEDAITQRTALLMKVHTSNYSIRGFTCSVSEADLAALARKRGIPLVTDLGSGSLLDLRRWGLPGEPTVRAIVEAGADLVLFSGDKLLGGPQCGILAGNADLVRKLARNPLKRALRLDKLRLAALRSVLELYLDPDRLAAKLPTLRMLTRSLDSIEADARAVCAAFAGVLSPKTYEVSVIDCQSQVGSGAFATETLPSHGVRIAPRRGRANDRTILRLHAALRGMPTPLIGRIENHSLVLDCRSLHDAHAVVAQIEGADLAHSVDA
jgi:L-seryl-tRNA(Ser) seleniumtransferase